MSPFITTSFALYPIFCEMKYTANLWYFTILQILFSGLFQILTSNHKKFEFGFIFILRNFTKCIVAHWQGHDSCMLAYSFCMLLGFAFAGSAVIVCYWSNGFRYHSIAPPPLFLEPQHDSETWFLDLNLLALSRALSQGNSNGLAHIRVCVYQDHIKT